LRPLASIRGRAIISLLVLGRGARCSVAWRGSGEACAGLGESVDIDRIHANGKVQGSLKAFDCRSDVGDDHGDHHATSTGTAGTARTMHVVLVIGWRIKMNDCRHGINVNASCRYVGCHEGVGST